MGKKKTIKVSKKINSELENWARWCWHGPLPHPIPPTHCESFEWQYERVREEGEIESVDDRPIPVNHVNANIVHGVYVMLPVIQAQILRAEYPQRFSKAKDKLIVQIGETAYISAFKKAVCKVKAAFDGVWD